MRDPSEIDPLIEASELELIELDARRGEIMEEIQALKKKKEEMGHAAASRVEDSPPVTNWSNQDEKISLFRSLFRGREDVFPRRFESIITGKKGYAPCCANEWARGVCGKPEIKCAHCEDRAFIPLSDKIIKSHFLGYDLTRESRRDFTIGLYVLLPDETCWLLAADFDKGDWMEDASAFLETCKLFHIPAALERSRSGNGGRAWIFFQEPIPARMARKLGALLFAETIERRPEIERHSRDRFIPGRDVSPKDGFGGFIALPLQKKPREKGNSVFLDENFRPHRDQWAFLSRVERVALSRVEKMVHEWSY
ncbi:MAG: hypothetical protein GY859_44585 [Desulfobacterales bacterium]|nr:hypothetical protein [Desulfobacterales bacterium]